MPGDKVTVDNGSLTDYDAATDTRTIGGASVEVQRVTADGGTGLATGQVTPTASAATLVAARETRKGLTVYNGTNVTVYIGPATLTTGNGFPLVPEAGVRITSTVLVQLIVASVTGMTGFVSYEEEYDA